MNKKLTDAAIGTGAVAAGVVVGPAAVVLKPGADLVQFLWGRATEARRQAMIDGLLEAIVDIDSCTLDDAEVRLAALLSDCTADQEDLIYESFRAMAFGRSRETWPLIARLTATYIVKKGGKPDATFKRVAWLLERCEDDDIAFIRETLSTTARLFDMPAHQKVTHAEWEPIYRGIRVSVKGLVEKSVSVRATGDRGGQVVRLLVEARVSKTGEFGQLYVSRSLSKSLNRLFKP